MRLSDNHTSSSSSTTSCSPRSSLSTKKRCPHTWIPYVITLVAISICCTQAQYNWCSRIVTYTSIRSYVETTKCNQSYQEACGFFTYEICTRYEMVDCMVERNKTVSQYRIIEGCCPGYKLDPVNNVTCISIYNATQTQEKVKDGQKVEIGKGVPYDVSSHSNLDIPSFQANSDSDIGEGGETKVSVSDADAEQTTVPSGGSKRPSGKKSPLADEIEGSVDYYTDGKREGSLFGLSNGAYAGILSILVFLLCVIILVSIRIHKRRRNEKLKKSHPAPMEMEVSQKMITDSQA